MGVAVEVISPFPAYAWPLVWQWMQTFRDRVCDDFAPKTCAEFVAQMLRAVNPDDSWGVYRDGELGGLIWVARFSPILGYSHMVFSRAFWGQETTLTAVQEVFHQVFERGAEKIESSSFVDNHQVKALGQKLGGTVEGVRRGRTLRRGELVDMLDYGLTKKDFYAIRNSSGHGDLGADQRRGRHRVRSAQQAEDVDQLDDAHALAGDEGAPGPPGRV
jgi:RimJ/RimL family protein N-acetyltransferase